MNVKFIKSVFDMKDAPKDNLPEFLLVGRSNVGKSSLINSLLKRKNIARTSQSPGKTISLNYYLVEDMFYLVDAPGYGYAKRSFLKQDEFLKIMDQYFLEPERIKLILMLIDYKVGPTEDDLQMLDYLRYNDLPYLIVLTKADKVKQSQKIKTERKIYDKIGNEEVILTSSSTKKGINKLRQLILNLIKGD